MEQIEAKDLRIGDYVECNDCICKIIKIDSYEESACDFDQSQAGE